MREVQLPVVLRRWRARAICGKIGPMKTSVARFASRSACLAGALAFCAAGAPAGPASMRNLPPVCAEPERKCDCLIGQTSIEVTVESDCPLRLQMTRKFP